MTINKIKLVEHNMYSQEIKDLLYDDDEINKIYFGQNIR